MLTWLRRPIPVLLAAVALTGCTPGATRHTGSCGYQLAPTGHGYLLTGEADIHDAGTGVVLVTFSWAQHGAASLHASRRVTLSQGQTMVVTLSRHATDTQIARLQLWRVRHNNHNGCSFMVG